MTTYRYTDESMTVAHVIDDQGISKKSVLVTSLPDSVVILPPIAQPVPVELSPVEKLREFLAANPDVAALL